MTNPLIVDIFLVVAIFNHNKTKGVTCSQFRSVGTSVTRKASG